MAYFGFAMILAIVYFIEWLETKADEKQTAKVERTHEQIYSLIDEHFEGREARERKAKADAMIGAYQKDNGRNYKPKHLKQVTTVEERKMRIKEELNGTADDSELVKAQILDALDSGFACPDDDDDWCYEEHTQDEKRERMIQDIMADGLSREEAEVSADKFFAFAMGV